MFLIDIALCNDLRFPVFNFALFLLIKPVTRKDLSELYKSYLPKKSDIKKDIAAKEAEKLANTTYALRNLKVQNHYAPLLQVLILVNYQSHV